MVPTMLTWLVVSHSAEQAPTGNVAQSLSVTLDLPAEAATGAADLHRPRHLRLISDED